MDSLNKQQREIIQLLLQVFLIWLTMQNGNHGLHTKDYQLSIQYNLIIITREAESKYVDFVTKLVPQWKQADHCENLETTDSGESNMSGGFGLKVSTISAP